jgi:hypothetical protein
VYSLPLIELKYYFKWKIILQINGFGKSINKPDWVNEQLLGIMGDNKKLLDQKMEKFIAEENQITWQDKDAETEYNVLLMCNKRAEEASTDKGNTNKVSMYDDGICVYNQMDKMIGYIGLNKNSPLSFDYRKHFYANTNYENETGCLLNEYYLLKMKKNFNNEELKISFDDYRHKKLREIFTIIFEKDMKEWLLSTDDAILAMCEPDAKFGLANEVFIDVEQPVSMGLKCPWTWSNFGQNIIGNIVMGIREKLRKK